MMLSSAKKVDAPTLILQEDDDQIVSTGASAMLSSKIVKNASLKVYNGAPHGICTTHKNKAAAPLSACAPTAALARLRCSRIEPYEASVRRPISVH